MASLKTAVIKDIFDRRFDTHTGELSESLVSFEDLKAAIDRTNQNLPPSKKPLRTNNLANFWKDMTRTNVLNIWPTEVLEAGFFGRDAIGEGPGASFRFVPYSEEDFKPFTIDLSKIPLVQIQTLTMPVEMKALGRRDENWFTQVVSRLGVVEAHFAFHSRRAVSEISFLQTGVKLKKGEADAVYSLTQDGRRWLVSVEAKGLNENFHPSQLARAAFALKESYARTAAATDVIPFLIKIAGKSLIYTAEFRPVKSPEDNLALSSEGLFQLVPEVGGIY